MTSFLLLASWILVAAAVSLALLVCKKNGKKTTTENKRTESTTTDGKKSGPPSKEVKEHNDKINAGMKRPQVDDETVDDQPTDWGQVQKVEMVTDPKSAKPASEAVDSKAGKVGAKK